MEVRVAEAVAVALFKEENNFSEAR